MHVILTHWLTAEAGGEREGIESGTGGVAALSTRLVEFVSIFSEINT